MKKSKIFVAGHRGMVGGAICRALERAGYEDILKRTRSELPLDDAASVYQFFEEERPDWVFLAAARVGGIVANDTYPADFIQENLRIQLNVIDAAFRFGSTRFCFLGSSCIYPKSAPQPIPEEALLTGPLEPTNSAYAIAKIAGKEMCDAYRKQFGWNAFTIMPCNVYGIGDNFHPVNSHVVAALIRKIHIAKLEAQPTVTVWGSGKPLREFIYSEDLGEVALFLMENYGAGGLINTGSAVEVTIENLAKKICRVVKYEGQLIFDSLKPDGAPRKIMDSSKLFAMGWKPKTELDEGLALAYRCYVDEQAELATLDV